MVVFESECLGSEVAGAEVLRPFQQVMGQM